MNFTDHHPGVTQNQDVTAMGGATTGKCLKCPSPPVNRGGGRPGYSGALFVDLVNQILFTADPTFSAFALGSVRSQRGF